ncbi:bromodomain adjacent to zinc finger domain protein 1A [Dunckerocampus dactyliophorus]|uniref:bromodomain adjacent to zinc finger domain protein 1A n=1 Tax=Dunckerocampus dactyliophorus TaxID=161453 RepID=UPI002406D26D|nr:bromodomain adjacent to zinc finger domain protein 1A [Dunckerocampus dactyliophorus]
MPLLHRRAFIRQEPPADLSPDEEVFLCRITHEVFRSYDEFFERTILCNSLVWSCALTGRAGLTYLEAVESERRAKQSLQKFPSVLVAPLLHLAALGRRGRLSELCEDVHAFVKERFFAGERVDVSGHNGARRVCEILRVLPPHSSINGPSTTNGHSASADGDTIVISDSDEEGNAFQSPTAQVNRSSGEGSRKTPLSPSVFKYEVRTTTDGHAKPFIVRANQISRRKNVVSRERLKLLFKQHCEPANGTIRLKASSVSKYRLSEQNFSQFFPDEPPQFPFSTGVKAEGRVSPGQASTSLLKVDKEKLKEEQRKRFEEEKQRRREEKERRKQEKDLEREKLKEEKKKYAERLRLWNKPREDMECDDLKELPTPVPVRTRLPAQLFGEALMVLEFLRAFGDDFGLKDEFPDGVSLEVLEEALVGSDPEGPLCELLFFFITAIFQALDEEREEATKDEDLSQAPDDDSDRSDLAVSAASSSAAAWPPLHLGCSLQEVDLDSCTLSEILRLHILASGADCNHGNAKFRYQKQGGFTLTDDPCVELCLAQPALMRRLACMAVYDLMPGEKLAILQALVGKLLSLASSRDLMENCVEEQRAARQELREVRAEQHRREREEAAHRVRLRKEERLREQEQRLKLKEQEVKDETKAEGRGSLTTSDPKALPCPPASLTAEEHEEEQQKVRELQERIQKAAACTSLLPLGRDRLYRRYWLLPSASALFVEEDSFGLTEDMLQPRPKQTQDPTTKMEDGEHGLEEPAEGSVGSSPAPLSCCGPPVSRPNQWFFYSSVEELDQLIDALNPRGHRESGLKEALLQERERLQELLQMCERSKYTYADDPESSRSVPECTAAAEILMEARLRDLLLDVEDRIHQGSLGTLKIMDRHVWRSALEAGKYELLCTDEETDTQVEDMEVDSTPLKARDRLLVDNVTEGGLVHSLARALAHVEHGIERRFLKAPLGEEDSKKDQKTKKSKKKDEDQASDDGSDSSRMVKTVLERWRESLLSSSSLSQVFVHLSSLERSVLWSRSVLNARCRVCRRKGDADNMLLCDACGRGHHTHCLRPRLKAVPGGDWFCPDCQPKMKSGSLPSHQHSSLDEEDDKEEEESEEESEEEEEESDEEEVVSTRKSQATPPKGRSHQATPKNRKKSSSSKPSVKKAMQLPSKTSMVTSGVKALPRPASKNTESSNRTSAGRNESSKKTTADTVPRAQPNKPVLPSAASSSSSRRRSSGRNHGVHELSACELLIVELVRHEDSWPFMKLVSRTQVPDYYDIISKPMALSTIREKVNNCQYLSAGEFMADVDLMFANCLQYNARHTNEAKAGIRLQQFFYSELNRLGLSERGTAPPTKRSRH